MLSLMSIFEAVFRKWSIRLISQHNEVSTAAVSKFWINFIWRNWWVILVDVFGYDYGLAVHVKHNEIQKIVSSIKTWGALKNDHWKAYILVQLVPQLRHLFRLPKNDQRTRKTAQFSNLMPYVCHFMWSYSHNDCFHHSNRTPYRCPYRFLINFAVFSISARKSLHA